MMKAELRQKQQGGEGTHRRNKYCGDQRCEVGKRKNWGVQSGKLGRGKHHGWRHLKVLLQSTRPIPDVLYVPALAQRVSDILFDTTVDPIHMAH